MHYPPRTLGLAAFFSTLGIVLVACAASQKPSPGVPNPQPPSQCLQEDAACSVDGECCSGSCENEVCVEAQDG
jgi:hypothetical protein